MQSMERMAEAAGLTAARALSDDVYRVKRCSVVLKVILTGADTDKTFQSDQFPYNILQL